MLSVRFGLFRLAAGLVVFAGCAPDETSKPTSERDFQFELLQVAANYRSWGRVDTEMHAAVLDCRAPSVPRPMEYSASQDASTHGQKLYTLYAKDRAEYRASRNSERVRVGQAIVKETWIPAKDTSEKPARAGEAAGLFVMLKLDPATPGTDDGWVYGTISADGTQVTSGGKVESCMKCHQDAKHDRLLGLAGK